MSNLSFERGVQLRLNYNCSGNTQTNPDQQLAHKPHIHGHNLGLNGME